MEVREILKALKGKYIFYSTRDLKEVKLLLDAENEGNWCTIGIREVCGFLAIRYYRE